MVLGFRDGYWRRDGGRVEIKRREKKVNGVGKMGRGGVRQCYIEERRKRIVKA